ncbi:amino acid ABC transporter permease [Prauserella cavernicola]|uniref:Amino acid ABC transporter permease n=1 Tax=Prauserella cavernicola TaxID=2800127 RepID=A0A934V5L3_9PSEU|nr:amino acid ABC transporter permease [Prauserella cavernicola]MBK1786627.1 amino acid ABC transporter permease [Prauserella cavernicola]
MGGDIDWSVVLGPEGRALLLSGLSVTLQLTVLGIVLSSLVGTAIALARVTTSPRLAPLRWLAIAVTEACRNVPFLIHISLWNFGVFGLPWVLTITEPLRDLMGTQFLAGLCALVSYRSAYMAEIVRSGWQSVSRGQLEAARSSGLSYRTATRYVILPQVVRIILPPLGNQYVTVTKNTALVLVIGVPDLVYQAYQIQSATFQFFAVFGVTMAIFSAVCLAEGALLNYLARRLDRRWGGQPARARRKPLATTSAGV